MKSIELVHLENNDIGQKMIKIQSLISMTMTSSSLTLRTSKSAFNGVNFPSHSLYKPIMCSSEENNVNELQLCQIIFMYKR